MRSILEYIENSAREFNNKIAVIEEDKKITYNELVLKSKQIASAIKENNGIRKPVPILMEKGINALCSFFGAVYAGDFYVLLNPDLPVSRLKDIFETLESDILLTDKVHEELAKEISNGKILYFEDIENTTYSIDAVENTEPTEEKETPSDEGFEEVK